jgi:hypothetical protein
MAENKRQAALNRSVFTQTAFDSSSLTVLTTLIHRFPEPGDYELFISSLRKPVRRLHVHVSPAIGDYQVNLDLASLDGGERSCGCGSAGGYELAVGGVMSFFVSKGSDKFSVKITQADDANKRKRTLLRSEEDVPEGDFFAVTLVQPGTYRAVTSDGREKKIIRVRMPKGKPYRVDEAMLIRVRKGGDFERRSVQLYPGQSVVFQMDRSTRIQLILEEGEGRPRAPDRRRKAQGRGSKPKGAKAG